MKIKNKEKRTKNKGMQIKSNEKEQRTMVWKLKNNEKRTNNNGMKIKNKKNTTEAPLYRIDVISTFYLSSDTYN